MKKRFGHESDKDSPHQIHDYIIYMAHENILMKRFDENKDSVVQHIKDMLPDLNLTGQWSLDVMQNGNDFYIIDMALAAESALKNYVPKGRLHPVKEDWIPELGEPYQCRSSPLIVAENPCFVECGWQDHWCGSVMLATHSIIYNFHSV